MLACLRLPHFRFVPAQLKLLGQTQTLSPPAYLDKSGFSAEKSSKAMKSKIANGYHVKTVGYVCRRLGFEYLTPIHTRAAKPFESQDLIFLASSSLLLRLLRSRKCVHVLAKSLQNIVLLPVEIDLPATEEFVQEKPAANQSKNGKDFHYKLCFLSLGSIK